MLIGLARGCVPRDGLATTAGDRQGWPETAPAHDHSAHGPGTSIIIQAVQGTRDGPKITGGDVTVELFGKDAKPRKMQAQLDANGRAVLKNLPVKVPFQSRVTIGHGGAFYQAVGRAMNPAHPHLSINVKVYETTDQAPAWDIAMRHIMLTPSADGLNVADMIIVRNPADRSWLGPLNSQGFRSSVVLDLPAGAKDISMSGALHMHWAKIVANRLYHTRPLVPGISHLRLNYTMPVTNGEARMEVVAPVSVKRLMVFLPDDGSHFRAEGLESTPSDPRMKNMRAYKAPGELPAGQQTVLIVSDLPEARAGTDGSANLSKILAAIGGGLVLILCVVILVIKPAKKRKAGSP
jgi:hypothetical protein